MKTFSIISLVFVSKAYIYPAKNRIFFPYTSQCLAISSRYSNISPLVRRLLLSTVFISSPQMALPLHKSSLALSLSHWFDSENQEAIRSGRDKSQRTWQEFPPKYSPTLLFSAVRGPQWWMQGFMVTITPAVTP